jgi:hypothetical protein
MNVYDLESFLSRLLKSLAAAISVSLTVLLLLNIFGPSVKGAPPDQAIMDVAGLMDAAGDSRERRITTVDFVDRPLFRPDRRQPPDLVSTSTKTQSDAALESSEKIESLEGVMATGVFASGDTSGVFLKAEGGERSRVQVGDNFEGWVLQSVDATGANFMAGGRGARVALQLNLNPVVLADPVAPDANLASDNSSASTGETSTSGADSRSGSADKREDNGGAPRQALTFDSMMQDRMRGRETQERERRE